MRLAAFALLASVAFAQDPPPAPPPDARDVIDREVKAKLADLKIAAGPRADDAEFLRRVSLDICGGIPTLDQAERFLADKSSDKRTKLVDLLLASEAYANNWSWEWAGTFVGHTGEGRQADTTIALVARQLRDLFAKNAPIDELAKRVISYTGKFEREDMRPMMMDQYEDAEGMALMYFRWQQGAQRDLPLALANKFSRAFLGTQISCAQCHDHPFDKWTQEDFYGMAAFFTGVFVRQIREPGDRQPRGYEVADRPANLRGRMRGGLTVPDSKGGPVKPAWLGTKEEPKAGSTLRSEFARMLTDRSNTQFATAIVNKYWAHFFGRGIVNPPDDFNGRNKPSHPALLEALASDFAGRGYDVRWLIREICLSDTYQRSSRIKDRTSDGEKYYATASVRALTPEQIMTSLLQATLKDPTSVPAPQRMNYLQQFRFAFGDDEDAELTDFEGTIPQALMMMNSELVARATGGGPGGPQGRPAGPGGARDRMRQRPGATRLAEIIETRKTDEERVRAIFLTVLTRPPTSKEFVRYVRHVRARDEDGLEDVMWALLNSSEFLFNH